jgi:hypothetical protein
VINAFESNDEEDDDHTSQRHARPSLLPVHSILPPRTAQSADLSLRLDRSTSAMDSWRSSILRC